MDRTLDFAAGGQDEAPHHETERLEKGSPFLVCQRDNFIADCLLRGFVAAPSARARSSSLNHQIAGETVVLSTRIVRALLLRSRSSISAKPGR